MPNKEKGMRIKKRVKKGLRQIISLFFYVMVAYGTARFLTDYLVQPVSVEGTSMEDTLFHKDILLINKLSYRIKEPKRFDIVIFPYSMNETYVKRIIGLPGESIQIKDGLIFINGKQLLEEYGQEKIQDAGIAETNVTLELDEYFLMGDNRNHSTDSRSVWIGPVKKEKIEGKVSARIYPFQEIRTFS